MSTHSLPRGARADVNDRQTAVYELRAKVRLHDGYWTTKDNTWRLDVWVAGAHVIKNKEFKTRDAKPPLEKAMAEVKKKTEEVIKGAHGSRSKITYVDLDWKRQ